MKLIRLNKKTKEFLIATGVIIGMLIIMYFLMIIPIETSSEFIDGFLKHVAFPFLAASMAFRYTTDSFPDFKNIHNLSILVSIFAFLLALIAMSLFPSG